MHLHAGSDLECRRLDLDEALCVEPLTYAPNERCTPEQGRAPGRIDFGQPPGSRAQWFSLAGCEAAMDAAERSR